MKSSIPCVFSVEKKVLAFRRAMKFRRAIKMTRRSMNDFVADTTSAVKRQPFTAIGVAAGVAFAVGALTGRFVKS